MAPRSILLLLVFVLLGAFAWWAAGANAEPAPAAVHARVEGEVPAAAPASSHGEQGELTRSLVSQVASDAAALQAGERLPDGAWWLDVIVLDAFEDPVEGALVELRTSRATAPIALDRSRSDGSCRLVVRGDVVYVRASHESVGRSILLDVTREQAAGEPPQRLLLLRAVLARGIALDGAGRPAAFQEVRIEGSLGYASPDGHVCPRRPLTTRVDGTFEFEGAAGAQLSALWFRDGEQVVRSSFRPSEDELIVLAEQGAFRVLVEAVDERGAAVPDAAFTLGWNLNGVFVDPTEIRFGNPPFVPDAPPSQLIASGPGDYYVVASSTGRGLWGREPVTISVQQPRPRVRVVMRGDDAAAELEKHWLPSPVSQVPVYIRRRDGEPAQEVSLWWRSENAKRASSEIVDRHHVVAFDHGQEKRELVVYDRATGQTGSFAFPPGAPPPAVHVTLMPGGSLELLVLHRGQPARAVEVEVFAAESKFKKRVDERGMVTFDDVPHGLARVRVQRLYEVLAEEQLHVPSGQLNRRTVSVELLR